MVYGSAVVDVVVCLSAIGGVNSKLISAALSWQKQLSDSSEVGESPVGVRQHGTTTN